MDTEKANAARMYDFFLGGSHNFPVDRAQAEQVIQRYPDAVPAARANRAYLGRVVSWCLEHGVDQFLDLGSGVPTVGNVHEIALQSSPAARIAYVDIEPVAVAHAETIVADLPTVTVTRADLQVPADVLSAPEVAGLLEFDRPVAVLAVGVLHFVADELPAILGQYKTALSPGSVLALNHTSDDHDDPAVAAAMRAACEGYRGSASEATLRDRPQIRALLDGLELQPPGLVDISAWPGPTQTTPVGIYGAVGVKNPLPR